MQYGLLETWCIAYECKNGNLHLNDNIFIAEIIDPNSSGGWLKGELVITSLYNKLMPIIRYRTGDIIYINYNYICECGQCSPIIKLDAQNNIIEGTEISSDIFFRKIILEVVNCNQYIIDEVHIEQYSTVDFVIYIKPGTQYNSNIGNKIVTSIQEKLGKGINVNIRTTKSSLEICNNIHMDFFKNLCKYSS